MKLVYYNKYFQRKNFMRNNTGYTAKGQGFTRDAFIRLAVLQCKLKSTITPPHELMKQIQAIRTWDINAQKINPFIQKVIAFSLKIKESKELLLCLIQILHIIPNSDPNNIMTILHFIIKNRKYMPAQQVEAYLTRGLNLMNKQVLNFGYIGLEFCLQFCFMTQNYNDFKIIMQRTIDILQVWVNQKFSQYPNQIIESSLELQTEYYLFSLLSLYKIGSMKFNTVQEQRQYNCRIINLVDLLNKFGIKYKTKDICNYLQNPIFKQKIIKLKNYTEHNCNLIRNFPNVKPIRFHNNKQNIELDQKQEKKRIRKIINIKKNETKKQDQTNNNTKHNNKLNIDHQVISHNIEATIEEEEDKIYNININEMKTLTQKIIQNQLGSQAGQCQMIPVQSELQFDYLYEEASKNYISELNLQFSNLDFVEIQSLKQIKSARESTIQNNVTPSYSAILSNNSIFSNPSSAPLSNQSNTSQQEQQINKQQKIQLTQGIIKQLIEQQLQNDINKVVDKQEQQQQQQEQQQYQSISVIPVMIQQEIQSFENKEANNKYIPYFNIRIQNNNTYIHIFYYLKYAHQEIIAVFNYSSQAYSPEHLNMHQIQSCVKDDRYFVIPFHILQSLSLVKDQIIHQTNYYFDGVSNYMAPQFLIYGVWVQTMRDTMKIMQNFATSIQIMYTVYEVCYQNHTVDIIISIKGIPEKRVSKRTEKRLSQYGNEQQQTILGNIKINGINIDTIKNIHTNIQQIIGYNIQITKSKLIINQSINYQDIIPIIL